MQLIPKAWAYYGERGLVEFVQRIHGAKVYVVFRKELECQMAQSEHSDLCFRVACMDDVPVVSNLHARYDGCQAPADLPARIRANELTVLGVSPADRCEVMYVSVASPNNRFFRLLPAALVAANDWCSQGIWVPNAHRGKGIARRGLRFLEYAAYQAGSRRLWAFVRSDNVASLTLHRTLDYEEYGLFRAGRWFGNRIAMIQKNGQRRWQHLDAEQVSETPHK